MATSGASGGERRDHDGLEWREVHQGAHPGDQFVRLARHRAFRRLGTGRYEIRASGLARSPASHATTLTGSQLSIHAHFERDMSFSCC